MILRWSFDILKILVKPLFPSFGCLIPTVKPSGRCNRLQR